MYALDLLTDRGLSVTADGDRLIVSPSDRLDDGLRTFIRQHKPEILQTLRGTVHGISLTELREAAGPDWPVLESDHELLETFALAVCTRRLRELGDVPSNYTAVSECAFTEFGIKAKPSTKNTDIVKIFIFFITIFFQAQRTASSPLGAGRGPSRFAIRGVNDADFSCGRMVYVKCRWIDRLRPQGWG